MQEEEKRIQSEGLRVGSLFALKTLYYTSVWIDLICVNILVVNEVISWWVSLSFVYHF
jgi:hypothetical protein